MPQKSRFAVPLEAKTRLTGDGRLRQSTCSELAEHLRGYCISKFYNYSLNKRNFMSACPLLQGSAKRLKPGLVKFVPAVAYHFCLNLPGAFSQPGKHSFGDTCKIAHSPYPFEISCSISMRVRGLLIYLRWLFYAAAARPSVMHSK